MYFSPAYSNSAVARTRYSARMVSRCIQSLHCLQTATIDRLVRRPSHRDATIPLLFALFTYFTINVSVLIIMLDVA